MSGKPIETRGRPRKTAKTILIEVAISPATLKSIAKLKKVTGLGSQGEVLDHVIARVIRGQSRVEKRPAKAPRTGWR